MALSNKEKQQRHRDRKKAVYKQVLEKLEEIMSFNEEVVGPGLREVQRLLPGFEIVVRKETDNG